MGSIILAEVTRGALVESIHRGVYGVVDNQGKIVASGGDIDYVSFMRSCAKPMQALPIVESGAADHYSLTQEELAVLTASHSGEEAHRRVVTSILGKINLAQASLQCGTHRPLHGLTAQELIKTGGVPDVLHCSCSGKHVGMLLLCQYYGWSIEDYYQAHHPVQQLMKEAVAQLAQVETEKIEMGIDGCGVPVFGLSIYSMALAYANLAGGKFTPKRNKALKAIAQAMNSHPQIVAGTGRFCTDLMAATNGKIVAKDGNEGVFCLALPQKGWGIALKIEDGSMRALPPIIVNLLEQLDILTAEELEQLASYKGAKIRNFRKEVIGEIRSVI